MSTKPNLYQKINNIMKRVKSVVKDTNVSTGGNRSYQAVSHDAVASLLHMEIANEGITVIPTVRQRQLDAVTVKNQYDKETVQFRAHLVIDIAFINSDVPNEKEIVTMDGFSFDSGDKAVGKAVSLAVKYALLKVFMLESLDEEESREAELQVKQYQPQPKKTVAQHTFKIASPERVKSLAWIKSELSKQPDWKTNWKDVMKKITGVASAQELDELPDESLTDITKLLLTTYKVEE